MAQFKLNFQASPLDTRDHVISTTNPTTATSSTSSSSTASVDLSSWCSSIKNQGPVGSCTAHASVALMEYFYNKNIANAKKEAEKNSKKEDLFSEKFVYYVTRVNIAGWPANDDCGAYLRDTMKTLVKYGTALEKTCPYIRDGQTECNIAETPSPGAYTEALNFQVTKYARVLETDKVKCLHDCKNLLNNGIGFVGGFLCYENILDEQVGKTGIVPAPPTQGPAKIIGGHAVLFIGYDDSKQLLKFKNSWGNEWGDSGYGYLPYSYLDKNLLTDLWTIYSQENNNISFDSISGIAVTQGIITPQSRDAELKRRVAELLSLIGTMDIHSLQQKINTNSRNAFVYKSDLAELNNLAVRIDSLCYIFFAAASKRTV